MARGFRGRVAVGAALVACALVPAAAGAAENGLIYIEASSPISSGQPAAPLANCPEDAHLVGAGGDSLVGVVPGLINSVTPFDDDDEDLKPDDGAYAYAFNTTGLGGLRARQDDLPLTDVEAARQPRRDGEGPVPRRHERRRWRELRHRFER
jgi:hypothetical protein